MNPTPTTGSSSTSTDCRPLGVEMRHSGGMTRLNPSPERDELLRVLGELASILRTWNEDRWADWIE